MKLLLYSHSFAPSVGGVETYVMLLARGLVCEVSQLVLATNTPADRYNDGSLPFVLVRQPGFIRLWRLIREADLVHLAGPCLGPLLIAFLQRKQVIVEHHGYQACCPNGLLLHQPDLSLCPGHFLARNYKECLRCGTGTYRIVKHFRNLLFTFLRRRLCQSAAANVAVSQHVARRLELDRCCVIYHGVADSYPDSGALHRIGAGADPLTFAYVGRMVAEKGLPTLIHAAKLLTNEGRHFRLKLIGDGPERSRLEALCREASLGDMVEFTGVLSGDQLHAALEDVAAVIMPSLCEEAAGLAAIEQMMRSRAVLAANVGGLSEIVGPTGLTFAPGDSNTLAACMRQVIIQPELLGPLGSQARDRALLLFRDSRMVADHCEVYRQAVS